MKIEEKTLYKCRLPDGKEYFYGDKILRIISIVVNTIELILIIYLLMR